MKGLQDEDLSAFELDEVPSGYVFCKEGMYAIAVVFWLDILSW